MNANAGMHTIVARQRRRALTRQLWLPTQFLALLALLTAGCVATFPPEIPPGYVLASDTGNGFVIGSVGVKPAQAPSTWLEWSRYDYRSLANQKLQGHITSAFKWNPYYMFGSMPLCADDGLEDECGLLFAILLPAGDYEFCCVTPAMESRTSSSTSKGWHTPLPGYRFTIRAGQATYIGNLLSRICIGAQNTWGHGNSVWSAVGDVADRYSRDVPLLRVKYPQLKAANITNDTMNGKPWLWRMGEPGGRQPPYGWPPTCSDNPVQAQIYLRGDEPEAGRN